VLNIKGFKKLKIDRQTIIPTLKRAGVLLAGQFISTKFEFQPGQLDVSMQNKEVGSLAEKLAIEEYRGKKLEVRFYSPYILSGIQVFDEEKLNALISSPERPIIFESNKDDMLFKFLVMPVSSV
jgi:DNA polymerase III sliding clamp (beta) subunit (PCNA family)